MVGCSVSRHLPFARLLLLKWEFGLCGWLRQTPRNRRDVLGNNATLPWPLMKSLLLTFGLVLLGVTAVRAASPVRPNILYFYVDDMGWGSTGPNGQAARKAANQPHVLTPNLDRLAATGINFTRGYGCHVCSPARSSQQSGFHQGHTFADRNDPDNAKKAMRAEDVLIGDVLSAAGYVTGYWGKWGYGGSQDLRDPVIENIQTLPTSHGYQHVLAELHHVRAHTFFQPTLWSAPASPTTLGGLELVPNTMAAYRNDTNYPNAPALQNHPAYPPTGYCDDAYAFAALNFVRAQADNYKKTGQPFIGLLAVQIPHAPFDEISQLPEWDRAYRECEWFSSLPAQAQQWAAMVTRIDAHFGNILAALDDHDITDETIVIFQSDNGGPAGQNNVVFNANGGLRGHKGSIYEGGIRVPLVVRWPAKINTASRIRAGSESDMVVDVSDLLPTFCELAGVPAPIGIDGVSIAPSLLGEGAQRRREFIIHEAGDSQSIIRGRYKLVRSQKSPLALYDLETDHAEENNLARQHPELVKELERLLLGERVEEPKGFANTYHHWMGGDGGVTSDSRNWSDYVYANAGITYMSDRGAPRASWIARMENRGSEPTTARGDADLEFLGLEIVGQSAPQLLELSSGINLTGRNEIRIADHGHLRLNGGTVSSLRWIDVWPGGTLSGTGTIEASLHMRGTLLVPVSEVRTPALQVRGEANLRGTLSVDVAARVTPRPGERYVVISADAIEGTFDNPDNEVLAKDGSRFSIEYTEGSVILTVDEP